MTWHYLFTRDIFPKSRSSSHQSNQSLQYHTYNQRDELRLLFHLLTESTDLDSTSWKYPPSGIDIYPFPIQRNSSITSSTPSILACILHRSTNLPRSPLIIIHNSQRRSTIITIRSHLPTPIYSTCLTASKGFMAFSSYFNDITTNQYPYKLSS
jgi:hypothetical protein